MALTPGRLVMFTVSCFSLVAMPIAAVVNAAFELLPPARVR